MFDFSQDIPIGCDHAGFRLKEFLVQNLSSGGYRFRDYGTFSEESVDYPDFVHPVAKSINDGTFKRGIVICGSGNGVSIVANKYPEVRSAICWTEEIAKLARLHNNANIIALPARFISPEDALNMVKIFFTTDFEGGRHQRRVEKISHLLK
ncbi:MAG: ribose 5-phosphate isomerase B [Bacteroidetes bacterium]|nr:ribose 5-phosphate isomerase B [Bacteroidota bacterium]